MNVDVEEVEGVEVDTVFTPEGLTFVGTCLVALRPGSKRTNPPLPP